MSTKWLTRDNLYFFYRHQAAKKDNDFVYHDKIPAADSLPEVKGEINTVGWLPVASFNIHFYCMSLGNTNRCSGDKLYNILEWAYKTLQLMWRAYTHNKNKNNILVHVLSENVWIIDLLGILSFSNHISLLHLITQYQSPEGRQ